MPPCERAGYQVLLFHTAGEQAVYQVSDSVRIFLKFWILHVVVFNADVFFILRLGLPPLNFIAAVDGRGIKYLVAKVESCLDLSNYGRRSRHTYCRRGWAGYQILSSQGCKLLRSVPLRSEIEAHLLSFEIAETCPIASGGHRVSFWCCTLNCLQWFIASGDRGPVSFVV